MLPDEKCIEFRLPPRTFETPSALLNCALHLVAIVWLNYVGLDPKLGLQRILGEFGTISGAAQCAAEPAR